MSRRLCTIRPSGVLSNFLLQFTMLPSIIHYALVFPLIPSALSLFVPPPVRCQVWNQADSPSWSNHWELGGPFPSGNGPEYRWQAQDEPYSFQANIKDRHIKLWSHLNKDGNDEAMYTFVLNDARGRVARHYLDTNPKVGCEAPVDFTSDEVTFVFARMK